MDDSEQESDLRYVRWLVALLVRDEGGRLAIAPHALAGVEETIHAGLDDPAIAGDLLDQVLRLAQGALLEGGELDLGRSLVSIVLLHPFGRARLEQTTAGAWTKFVERPAQRAPLHDGPTPEGSVPLGTLFNVVRW